MTKLTQFYAPGLVNVELESFAVIFNVRCGLLQVVLPLAEVRNIESSASGRSERDKSIKVEMTGGEQFWFFGFVTFDKALMNLQHAGEVHKLRSESMKIRGA